MVNSSIKPLVLEEDIYTLNMASQKLGISRQALYYRIKRDHSQIQSYLVIGITSNSERKYFIYSKKEQEKLDQEKTKYRYFILKKYIEISNTVQRISASDREEMSNVYEAIRIILEGKMSPEQKNIFTKDYEWGTLSIIDAIVVDYILKKAKMNDIPLTDEDIDQIREGVDSLYFISYRLSNLSLEYMKELLGEVKGDQDASKK